MDLGLTGRKAIICASSRGLGRACALSLARNGVTVVINGRSPETIEATADMITRESGSEVIPVVSDLDTEEGRKALLNVCPEPDILVNNNGGPPPGDFRDWTEEDWMAGLRANLLAPTALIQATVDGMAARGFGRIVNITSVGVRMPFAGLGISSAARAGVTAYAAGVAREVAAKNVTINNLQPGLFDTDRLRTGLTKTAEVGGRDFEAAAADLRSKIPANRFGVPNEFGETCAFLCSAQAGFITGQNILVDGGHFPGMFS